MEGHKWNCQQKENVCQRKRCATQINCASLQEQNLRKDSSLVRNNRLQRLWEAVVNDTVCNITMWYNGEKELTAVFTNAHWESGGRKEWSSRLWAIENYLLDKFPVSESDQHMGTGLPSLKCM